MKHPELLKVFVDHHYNIELVGQLTYNIDNERWEEAIDDLRVLRRRIVVANQALELMMHELCDCGPFPVN